MTLDPGTQLLVILLLDELKEALRRQDATAAINTIEHIATVAGRDYADRLTNQLIAIVLNRLATASLDDTGNGEVTP